MTTYTRNTEHNGIEITFDNKPNEEIRNILKSNGYRWHRVKKLWYAKETAKTLEIAERLTSDAEVQDFSDWTGEHTDGYLGTIAWNGSKSDKFLYGAELSKAIRQDLKEHGIKGCTVSCSTYSGGQSLTVKVKCSDMDFISFDEWKQTKSIENFESYGRIYKRIELIDRGKYTFWDAEEMNIEEYYKMNEEEQAEIFNINAKHRYERVRSEQLNTYYLERYDTFNEAFARKIQLINACINSYRYDDSNSMVDYFDTNFYYDIELNYKATA